MEILQNTLTVAWSLRWVIAAAAAGVVVAFYVAGEPS